MGPAKMAGAVVLVWHANGMPIDLTRTVPVGGSRVALIQGAKAGGPGTGPTGVGTAAGTTFGHPAITTGDAPMMAGCPLNLTRGFSSVGVALPPCAHCI